MAKTPCEMWHELIHGTDPYAGPLYSEFVKEKDVLAGHLDECKKCRDMVNSLLLPTSSASDLKGIPDPNFSTAIRALRNLSRKRKGGTP